MAKQGTVSAHPSPERRKVRESVALHAQPVRAALWLVACAGFIHDSEASNLMAACALMLSCMLADVALAHQPRRE